MSEPKTVTTKAKSAKRKAAAAVLRAAVAWVEFEDRGSIFDMKRQVQVNTRLVNSVERLKKLMPRKKWRGGGTSNGTIIAMQAMEELHGRRF